MKQNAPQNLVLIPMFLAGAISIFSFCVCAATPAANPTGSTDDLRAAFATPPDIAEGKRLAGASCAGCHGSEGVARARDVPHLAGQRPGYLYAELRTYQTGGRSNVPMVNAVKFLSDDALVKVAAYYASLDPPNPAVTPRGASGSTDPVAAGKAAAAACAGCHGDTGISGQPGTPSLAALDPKFLADGMRAYKNGQRKNDTMKAFVAALSDADMGNIALFYALQKPGKTKSPSPGNQAAGKTAAAACDACHGEAGIGSGNAPALAGQDAEYFVAAIHGYKDGSRADATMKGQVASMDDTAAKNLAAYYANQQPQPSKTRKPASSAELADRCNRCHGVDGNSVDPRAPALAAQRAEYLERVLRAYQKGERKSTAMTAMLDGLGDADIKGLAGHYARQKARAVIFVPLPVR